jgi:hypothetical protein
MAAYTKYFPFVEDLHKAVHNFSTHVFKIALSNGTPSQAHATLSQITELSTANGYTAGGLVATITGFPQVSGTLTLVAADPSLWTASGAGIAFRYAALYNDTAAGKPLVAYWDNGSTITVTAGNTLGVDFGATLFTQV